MSEGLEKTEAATRPWVGAALVGGAYFLIGVVSGGLAANAATIAGRNRWRLAAWILSGVIFAAQIAYDRLRLHHPIGKASFHAAAAAAVGGFLLAVSATIHTMNVGTVDARYLLALVIWPLAVAVPAFVVALVLSVIIRPRNRDAMRLGSLFRAMTRAAKAFDRWDPKV